MLTDEKLTELFRYSFGLIDSRMTPNQQAFCRLIESAACAERDARIAELTRELAEARKDAELLDYIQTNGATVEIIPGAPDFYPVRFRVGGRYRTANESIRAAIRAAIKDQT